MECGEFGFKEKNSLMCFALTSDEMCCSSYAADNGCTGAYQPGGSKFPQCATTCGYCKEAQSYLVEPAPQNPKTYDIVVEDLTTRGPVLVTTQEPKRDYTPMIAAACALSVFMYVTSSYLLYRHVFSTTSMRTS